MKKKFILLCITLFLFLPYRVEAIPINLILATVQKLIKIGSTVSSLIDIASQIKAKINQLSQSQKIPMIENNKSLNERFSQQINQKLISETKSEQLNHLENLVLNQDKKIDDLSKKMDIIHQDLKLQNENIKKLFDQFDVQLTEIKDIKQNVELSQDVEFPTAIALFNASFKLLEQDPNAHPAEMANALSGFTKTEIFMNSKMANGKNIGTEQQATLYFYLISCYLYYKDLNNIKKYTTLLLKIPVEGEILNTLDETIVYQMKNLKEEYKRNINDSIKISQINAEIKMKKSYKNDILNYKKIYETKSMMILAYQEFAKNILKEELKISEDELKNILSSNDFINQKNGLELEIMYKLAYRYNEGKK